MKNLYQRLTYLFLFFFINCCISCSLKKNKIVEFKVLDNSYLDEKRVSEEKNSLKVVLKSANIYGFFTDITVVDSILICGNLRSPMLISVYSLNSDTLIKEVIVRGTDFGQGLSISNLYIQKNTDSSFVWAYDITLGKIFKIDMSRIATDMKYFPEEKFELKEKLKNIVTPQLISDSILMGTTYSLNDCRYAYANKKSILKKIGKLPDVSNNEFLADPPNTKLPNKSWIFKALITKHPFQNKVALFYCKSNRAEFYIDDRLVKVSNGKETFGPKMSIKKLKNGYSVDDCEETIFGFLSVSSTSNLIFGLYSGKKNYKTSSNTVLVFDWLGNFRKKIILNKEVCKIFFDEKRNILYCYENTENGILSATLEF